MTTAIVSSPLTASAVTVTNPVSAGSGYVHAGSMGVMTSCYPQNMVVNEWGDPVGPGAYCPYNYGPWAVMPGGFSNAEFQVASDFLAETGKAFLRLNPDGIFAGSAPSSSVDVYYYGGGDGVFNVSPEIVSGRPSSAIYAGAFQILPPPWDEKGYGDPGTGQWIGPLNTYYSYLDVSQPVSDYLSAQLDAGLLQFYFEVSGGTLTSNYQPVQLVSSISERTSVPASDSDPASVPTPIPFLGVAAAFGFSRQLRKRIKRHRGTSAVSTSPGA